MKNNSIIICLVMALLLTGCDNSEIFNGFTNRNKSNSTESNDNTQQVADNEEKLKELYYSDELFKKVLENDGLYTDENGTEYTFKEYQYTADMLQVRYPKNEELDLASKVDLEVNFLKSFKTEDGERYIFEIRNTSDKYAFIRKVEISDKFGNTDNSTYFVRDYQCLMDMSFFYVKPNSKLYYVYNPIYVDFDITKLNDYTIALDVYGETTDEYLNYDDYIFDAMLLDNIEMHEKDMGEEIAFEFVNNNDRNLSCVSYEIVYYKDNEVVYVDDIVSQSIDYAKKGESIYDSKSKPEDQSSFLSDGLDYDEYEIIVFSAYATTKMYYPFAKDLQIEILKVEKIGDNNEGYNVFLKISNPTNMTINIDTIHFINKPNGSIEKKFSIYAGMSIPANSYVYYEQDLYNNVRRSSKWNFDEGKPIVLISKYWSGKDYKKYIKNSKDYEISSVKTKDDKIEITLKNNNVEKSITNFKYEIAFFKDGEIVGVKTEYFSSAIDSSIKIKPNGKYVITDDCKKMFVGKLDFDDYEVLLTRVSWE